MDKTSYNKSNNCYIFYALCQTQFCLASNMETGKFLEINLVYFFTLKKEETFCIKNDKVLLIFSTE